MPHEINNGFPVMNPDTKDAISLMVPLVSGFGFLLLGAFGLYVASANIQYIPGFEPHPIMLALIIMAYPVIMLNSMLVAYFFHILTQAILEKY